MRTRKKPSQEEIESALVEDMSKARAIAQTLFGDRSNLYAIHEIYDYLAIVDEEEFAADLKRIIERTKVVHETDAPTPEQVFGMFERAYPSDEE